MISTAKKKKKKIKLLFFKLKKKKKRKKEKNSTCWHSSTSILQTCYFEFLQNRSILEIAGLDFANLIKSLSHPTLLQTEISMLSLQTSNSISSKDP